MVVNLSVHLWVSPIRYASVFDQNFSLGASKAEPKTKFTVGTALREPL